MILTVDELRQFVDFATGTDADAALQQLLDATEADIEAAAGAASGNVVELIDGGWTHLIVSRPLSTVVSIVTDTDGTPLTLSANDYRFTSGGFVLRRLGTGTNPGGDWAGVVTVTYTAVTSVDQWATIQMGLVRLALAYNPGLLQMRIGDWQETYQATNSVSGYAIERAALLATLASGPAMAVMS